MQTKLNKAVASIIKCRASNGFFASADRYKNEYWTRDFYYSIDALLSLGLADDVKGQIMHIWKHQSPLGDAPRYIIDNRFKWFFGKLSSKILNRKVIFTLRTLSTMETRFNRWTVDSTILAILATHAYSKFKDNRQILEVLKPKLSKAVHYVERTIKDYLVIGGDWRDSMPWLANKFLLSNNVMLYKLCKAIGKTEHAKIVKDRINSDFWNGSYYVDFLEGQNFDVLGTSLAVLEGIVPSNRYHLVSKKLLSASEKYGIKNIIETVLISKEEDKRLESCNQRHAVWPFISCYAIMALDKMGMRSARNEQIRKIDKLDGFYEWYNPDTGAHGGSRDQLWNAAMYYSMHKHLKR